MTVDAKMIVYTGAPVCLFKSCALAHWQKTVLCEPGLKGMELK